MSLRETTSAMVVCLVAFTLTACQGEQQGTESVPSAPEAPQTTSTDPVPTAPPGEAQDEKALAAFPYSADDIRDATKAGRSFTLKFEMDGVKTSYHEVEFLSVDDEGCMTRGTNWEEGGEKTLTEEERVTWTELQAHASYPLATTVIRVDRIETALGEFTCLLYEQIGSDGQPTARVWFAMALPGPPILMEDLDAGVVKFRAIMIESVMP